MVDGEHPRAPHVERVAGEQLYDYDPTVIGPYTLLSRLGAGGMGTVYLAEDRGGRLVAVKVVRPDLASNEEFRRRFRAEMAAVRRVAPFCTAEVLDADADARLPYMVTEFIEGIRLDLEVSARGPLRPSILTGTAVGVATALTAIHRAGLVHRDLKPSNVILSLSGPRVIDFGIAQALDGTVANPTRWGFGSAGWMAPEQVNGEPIGPAADVFTWGILIAYAGTGRHPFGEGSDLDVTYRIVSAEPDLDGLHAPIEKLVAVALAKRPADRPTARDLLLQLVERVPDDAVSAPIGSASQLLGMGVPGEPGPAAAGGPGSPGRGPTRVSAPSFDAAGHPAGGAAGGAPPSRPPTGDDGRNRRRGRVGVAVLGVLVTLAAVAVALAALGGGGSKGGTGGSSTPSPTVTATATATPSPTPSQTPTEGFRDGQLAFTVKRVRCGLLRSGTVFAGIDTRLCAADVTVRNVGNSTRFFYHDKQFLFDTEGISHPAERWDFGQIGQVVPITEGSSTDRTLVFRVPNGTEPDHLELQDSDDDGGVRVPIPDTGTG
jgi:hypothetical protein